MFPERSHSSPGSFNAQAPANFEGVAQTTAEVGEEKLAGFHPGEKDACAAWDLLELPAEAAREGLGDRCERL